MGHDSTPQFQITGTTRVYGMIADPISHVRAPMVFNPVFEERGLDAVMVPLHLTPQNLAPAIRALVNVPNFGGVCVSIPHKMELAAICDELGLAAQLTGAVNAVRFENGRLIGDNFDGKGFVAGLKGEGIDIAGKSVLMIGAGGAARAIAAALAETDARRIDISNRTTAKAAEIVAMLSPLENTPELGVTDSKTLTMRLLMPILLSIQHLLACMRVMPCHVSWTTPKRCCYCRHYHDPCRNRMDEGCSQSQHDCSRRAPYA